MFKTILVAGAFAAGLTFSAQAESAMEVHDAYARSASPAARTGAIFMMIHNHGSSDDRLVGAASPAAERVELHTHVDIGDGVLRMVEVEDGFPVPAGGEHLLQRGGDHVMLMGLTGPLEQGATVPLTLIFEQAGEIAVEVTVDVERAPHHDDGKGMKGQHHMGH